MKKIILSLILVAVCGAAVWWGNDRFRGDNGDRTAYRLAKIEQRDIVKNVTAIGEVSALVTVEVGSEVSGQIKELLVDYNSPVKAGQIIARIDPEGYETIVRQGKAELAVYQAQLQTQMTRIQSYEASVESAEADLDAIQASIRKADIVLKNAKQTLERQKKLMDQEFISETDYEESEATYEESIAELERLHAEKIKSLAGVAAAKASLAVAQSEISEAEAGVELKLAALAKCNVDLENTIIRSPVDGVVIDRSVDVGQTVAASLQTPTLFTIAQDLRKMQVTTSVDEADIGQIKEGQSALFTVDAYNDRKFPGQVTQIRKQGTTVQNVVTYEVIISANNSELSLLPGMTADVAIELLKKNNVMVVPNSALRFTPTDAQSKTKSGLQAASAAGQKAGFGLPPARPRSGGQPDFEDKIKHYTEKLELTESQQDELKQIFLQSRQKMKQNRESQGMAVGSRPRSSSLKEKARKESQAAILRLLDSNQKLLFEKMTTDDQTRQGILWRLNEQGKIGALPVRLGVSDGSFTEIDGRGLEKGMEIIIGYQF